MSEKRPGKEKKRILLLALPPALASPPTPFSCPTLLSRATSPTNPTRHQTLPNPINLCTQQHRCLPIHPSHHIFRTIPPILRLLIPRWPPTQLIERQHLLIVVPLVELSMAPRVQSSRPSIVPVHCPSATATPSTVARSRYLHVLRSDRKRRPREERDRVQVCWMWHDRR